MIRRINFLISVGIIAFCLTACSDDDFDLQSPSLPADSMNTDYTRAVMEGERLIYTHGVGFSYNGLYGEYCNAADVRCQVIDLDSLRKYDRSNIYRVIYNSGEQEEYKDGFSLTEYVQNTYVSADAEADVAIVFAGSVQANFNIWQHGLTNSYFCKSTASVGLKTSFIDEESLAVVIKRYDYGERLLTRNFREALARLKKQLEDPSVDKRRIAIDSLIARYGTHVVTSSTIGGSIELEMRINTDTLRTIYDKKLIADMTLAVYKNRQMSENEQKTYHVLNSADCRLTVRGGNTSLIDSHVIGFKWGENRLKGADVSQWKESVNESTAAMTSMSMIPIWKVIPDQDLAKRVEAHITGESELLLELYGYQNFVSTKFPAHPQTDKGGYGCNILTAGRYVAAVYQERVNAISQDEDVWVAYPVYNQQVNLASGLCIYNGVAYRVGWQFNNLHVEQLNTTDVPADTIYMNGGVLEPFSKKGLKYLGGKPVVAYEWPSAINTAGSVNTAAPWYYVYKRGNYFYLRSRDGMEQTGMLGGLPNWSYNTTWQRMVRNGDYYYYYNEKEVEKL